MQSFPLTSLATLLAIAVLFWTMVMVGQARRAFGIAAPAVTGNEQFERCYRVQMNTLEQAAIFLPALWLCAIWVGDIPAAVGGLAWAVGRVLYGLSYPKDPKKRGPGFMIGMTATFAMSLASAAYLILSLK